MDNKKDELKINKAKTSKLMDFIQNSMDVLYRNTYFSKQSNSTNLQGIKTTIDTSLNKVSTEPEKTDDTGNMNSLYTRIDPDKKGVSSTDMKNLEDIFNDQSITDGIISSFSQNKYLTDYDQEIDLICRYMPSLADALDAKKDNVLSADHFSKDFINVVNLTNTTDLIQFNSRIDEIKKKYNLLEFLDTAYDNTAKYGEQFIYMVPYKEALSKLLRNKQQSQYQSSAVLESCIQEQTIYESFDMTDIVNESSKYNGLEIDKDYKLEGTFNLEINKSGVIGSVIKQHCTMKSVLESKIVDDDLELEGIKDNKSNDGFIDMNKTEGKKINIKVPGCILKKIKRENVIPIYIDDTCLGYYYLEIDNNNKSSVFNSQSRSSLNDPMSTFRFNKMASIESDVNKDNTLKILSSKLSKYLDEKFINANQDLRKEIYMILKHNDFFMNTKSGNMKVTFIHPDNMVHMYFNKDQDTNRGISDLDKSLIAAKLYTCLYVTNTLGILTRGHDKRVYYVKQNVDTNISKVLLNTISQIKKSNFGMREISNVKDFFNITGRFNDYVIPVGPSGDSPIQFEVMPGQQIDTHDELLDMLNEMAVNATDVPFEYIQSRKSVDFATRLTISSGKFLRKAFKRQSQVEAPFTRILKKIYNCEFDNDDTLEMILPPPAFLNIMNTNQMLENVAQYVQSVMDMEFPGQQQDDPYYQNVARKLKRQYLATYLDTKVIDNIKREAKIETEIEKKNNEDEM